MRHYFVKLRGIHHITAIATDPQPNVDFYTGVLGLRLVKRTVNFDDPGTYHLYFGDRTGQPGTAMTFFPWPGARRGTRGTGQVIATGLAISESALDYWQSRFKEFHVLCEHTNTRFGDEVLRIADVDGLLIELITSPHLEDVDPDYESEVPREFAIRGFHAPTLEMRRLARSEKLLQALGFELMSQASERQRFAVDTTSTSGKIDIVERPQGSFGVNSAGTVHHIAFRCDDEPQQLEWRKRIVDLGLHVTPVIDRFYFHSIYFREPNGILFEIATDGPGFTADEPAEHLGENLQLPPQFETHRAEIEGILPPLALKLTARHPSK
ncbi:MAG TPA: ring-cleaving dioxygenase [Chthoniobacterales bacterium]|jgi:glyoxalase family protein